MDLSLVLLTDSDIVKVGDISKIKGLNKSVLSKLEAEANTYFEEHVIVNYDLIDRFMAGDQWGVKPKEKKNMAVNYVGQPVYDLISTFNKNISEDRNKARRTLNLTKSYIESLVANHAEVDPMPTAVSAYDYAYDQENLDKINLLLDSIFQKENKIDELYESICNDSYKYGSSYVYICLDYDKSKTSTPVKLKLIHPKDVRYDPTATNLEEADYVIMNAKMRYYNIRSMYKVEVKKGKDQPEDTDIVDIKYWWFRHKNIDANKTVWLCFCTYDNEWLKPLNEKGKFEPEYVYYEELPLVKFSPKVFNMNDGSSIATELMPINVQYNQLMTEEDYNFQKFVNRPLITNLTKEDVTGNIPYGIQTISPQDTIQPMNVDLVGAGELEARKNSLKQQALDATGIDFRTLGGEKGRGIYSDKLMQTVKKMAETKPRMYERHLLDSLELTAKKSLYMMIKHLDGKGVTLFNPKTQKTITITENDIYNSMYTLMIDTKDANLITRETRFEILTQFMQYSQGNPLLLYPMAMMTNNAIPHIFPDDVIAEFKKMYDNAMQMQTAQTQSAITPTEGMPPEGSIPTGGMPTDNAEVSSDQIPGISDDVLENQWMYYQDQLQEVGFTQPEIDEIYQKFVTDQKADGISNEEILMNLEESVNQAINIKLQGE